MDGRVFRRNQSDLMVRKPGVVVETSPRPQLNPTRVFNNSNLRASDHNAPPATAAHQPSSSTPTMHTPSSASESGVFTRSG